MSGVVRSDTIFGNAGKVLVYHRSGSNWSLVQSLVSGDPQTEGDFGWSVDLAGNRAIVGAFSEAEAYAVAGAAYVFERTGSTWAQTAQFLGDTVETAFAISVGISGDYAVVGAPFPGPPTFVGAGLAFVYRRDSLGTWLRDTTLHASDGLPYIEFGYSVAIDGDVIVVGATRGVIGGTVIGGAAYVFRRSGSAWVEEAKLAALDPHYHDWFGRSVSVSGDTVIVGANGDDERGTDAGAAYVFERDPLGVWHQVDKLMPASLTSGDEYGKAVGIDAPRAIAGAWLAQLPGVQRGAAWMYTYGNWSWNESALLYHTIVADAGTFGASVSVSGNCAMVGDPNRRVGSTVNVGASYIYCFPEPGIEEVQLDIICCWQPPNPIPPVIATVRYRNVGRAQVIARRRIELVSPSGRATESISARSIALGPGETWSERVVLQAAPPSERGRHELRLRWLDAAGERIERAFFTPPATNQAALGSRQQR